ncbi:MAG: DUF2330 domain-containing protein [Candidatus Dormiibacterota bacterium]
MLKRLAIAALTAGAALTSAIPAAACGGLVAPNGAIRLQRASTLVAWHDGVEHYMTSFAYAGTSFDSFGWIVPLPAVPDKVEEGGGWTLQRLNRETHPQPRALLQADGLAAGSAAPTAEVLQQVQVRALDITVLKGSGDSIVEWCKQNGFLLDKETKAHLQVYANGSPVFMAAKYNVDRAQATGQRTGDGAPVLITMHTDRPWVPLEVLANGTDTVNADLYLLTDNPIYTSDLAAAVQESPAGGFVPGAPGLAVQYQKPVSDNLFRDLSSDKNMGWVPRGAVLTYMTLTTPASTVSYDMGISDGGVVHLASYGTKPMDVGLGVHAVKPPSGGDNQQDVAPGIRTLLFKLAVVGLAGGLVILVLAGARRRRRQRAASEIIRPD